MATGMNGAIVLLRVEEARSLAAGNAIIQLHSMVEKIAQVLDLWKKQRNAILMNALVSVSSFEQYMDSF